MTVAVQLALSIASILCEGVATPAHLPATASTIVDIDLAAGRKTVTVYADNETEAVSRAESSNAGWTAVSAKKTSKDPKSRAWQVVMKKG